VHQCGFLLFLIFINHFFENTFRFRNVLLLSECLRSFDFETQCYIMNSFVLMHHLRVLRCYIIHSLRARKVHVIIKHKIEAPRAEVHHMSPLPSHVGSALSYYQADN
jgi:hypothetical protein